MVFVHVTINKRFTWIQKYDKARLSIILMNHYKKILKGDGTEQNDFIF